jgi:hypothetical protein
MNNDAESSEKSGAALADADQCPETGGKADQQ